MPPRRDISDPRHAYDPLAAADASDTAISTPDLPPNTFQILMYVLNDPRFETLHRIIDDHPLTWDEFKTLPMPAHASASQVWDILNTLRRHLAIELPFKDVDGKRGWFYPSRRLLKALETLEKRCQKDSWLDMTMQSRSAVGFTVGTLVSERVSDASEDGYCLPYEDARAVILEERKPETPEERLVVNAERAFTSLDSSIDEPCSRQTLTDLFEIITDGIEKRPAPEAQGSPVPWKSNFDAITAQDMACRIVNANRDDNAEHPLLLASGIRTLFKASHPFPCCNITLSSMLMKLVFKKAGLPVLDYVPLNRMFHDWECGIIAPPEVLVEADRSWIMVDGEFDYTLNAVATAQLCRKSLDDLERGLLRIIERDKMFENAMNDEVDYNHRQRDIIRTALANPKAVFRIESHRRTYGVAYATARADLLGLANRGLLRIEYGKRAFEFTVSQDLRKNLLARSTSRR